MREFYFEDKKKQISYRGYAPHNDENWKPLEYVIYPHAYNRAKIYLDHYEHGCFGELKVNEQFFFDKALDETIEMIKGMIAGHKAPTQLMDLLKFESLPKRQQEKRLKDLKLTATDILCFWIEADIEGYLLDSYHFETYPDRYNEKQHPMCYAQKPDGSIETIGNTEMSDGEMKALLHDRKVVVARILHKDEHWHCFYHTFKGLAGEEPGENGSKPHWHYISDKFGITREDLQERLKNCDLPQSKSHIFIKLDKELLTP